jgi:hypothetical protein
MRGRGLALDRRGLHGDLALELLAVAKQGHRHLRSGDGELGVDLQILAGGDRHLAPPDDHVAWLDASELGRRAPIDAGQQGSAGGRQTEGGGQRRVEGLGIHPERRSRDVALVTQARQQRLGHVDGDREPDPLGGLHGVASPERRAHTPTTCPDWSMSGPPELPRLIEASVWMKNE